MCLAKKVSEWLLVIGGLNWGLVGAANFNLVDAIFGLGSILSKIVYILVGLAAVVVVLHLFKMCPCTCMECSAMMPAKKKK